MTGTWQASERVLSELQIRTERSTGPLSCVRETGARNGQEQSWEWRVISGPRESPSKGFDGMGLKLTLFSNSPQGPCLTILVTKLLNA